MPVNEQERPVTEGMPRPRPASLEQAMDPSVPVVGVVGLHRALEVLRNG